MQALRLTKRPRSQREYVQAQSECLLEDANPYLRHSDDYFKESYNGLRDKSDASPSVSIKLSKLMNQDDSVNHQRKDAFQHDQGMCWREATSIVVGQKRLKIRGPSGRAD